MVIAYNRIILFSRETIINSCEMGNVEFCLFFPLSDTHHSVHF